MGFKSFKYQKIELNLLKSERFPNLDTMEWDAVFYPYNMGCGEREREGFPYLDTIEWDVFFLS